MSVNDIEAKSAVRALFEGLGQDHLNLLGDAPETLGGPLLDGFLDGWGHAHGDDLGFFVFVRHGAILKRPHCITR